MVDTSIFQNIQYPTPLAAATQAQTLTNAQLAAMGQSIQNDTATQQLQMSRITQMKKDIGSLIADPNVTKQKLYDVLDTNQKQGIYTSSDVANAKQVISQLPDDPTAIHAHLAQGLLSATSAETAL